MPQIGTFERTQTGFTGQLRTAALDLALVLVDAELGDTENAPAFRIHLAEADGPEIGAAWKRSSDKAGDYLALSIDDPTFVLPVRANLFRSGETSIWHAHWSRPNKRADQAQDQ